MNNSTVYKIADNVKIRVEEFGLLVISRTTPALALNNDMKNVWELIDGNNSVNDIFSIISRQYESEHLEEQINDIFDNLLKLKLIEVI
jgi:hypothetical protein